MCDHLAEGRKRCKDAAMVSLMASSLVITSSKEEIAALGESYKPALAYAYSELVKSLAADLEPSAELAETLTEDIRFYISEFTADYVLSTMQAKRTYTNNRYKNNETRRSLGENSSGFVSEKTLEQIALRETENISNNLLKNCALIAGTEVPLGNLRTHYRYVINYLLNGEEAPWEVFLALKPLENDPFMTHDIAEAKRAKDLFVKTSLSLATTS